MHRAFLEKKFCTGLIAFRTLLLSGEVRNFDSYRTEFLNAVFALLEEVNSAATAEGRPFVKSSCLKSFFLAREMETIQQSVAAAA